MALLDRIKDAVGAGEPDVTHNYHCRECKTKFESDEAHLAEVECPDCGVSGSRNIARM